MSHVVGCCVEDAEEAVGHPEGGAAEEGGHPPPRPRPPQPELPGLLPPEDPAFFIGHRSDDEEGSVFWLHTALDGGAGFFMSPCGL